MPFIPNISLSIVDVTDTAMAHLRALQKLDETDGKRYILCENTYWYRDIVSILKKEFG